MKMPQMAPLAWLPLMVVFNAMLMMLLSMIFWTRPNSLNLQTSSLNINTLKFSW